MTIFANSNIVIAFHVPIFINEGDMIKVDSASRAYVERVKE